MEPQETDNKVIEFKLNHPVTSSEQLSASGRPVIYPDGRPVAGRDLEVGRVYVIDQHGVLRNGPTNRAARRRAKAKGR